MTRGLIVLIVMSATSALPACKSGRKKSDYEIFEFIPSTLRVRRPGTSGANPQAGPGGRDYRSEVAPSETYDCETIGSLYRGLPLDEIRACLLSADAARVVYRLRRDAQPYWQLEDVDEAPECMREKLPRIPVPREILFQTQIEKRIDCYSARVDLTADEWLGTKVPLVGQRTMAIDLPVGAELLQGELDAALIRLLGSWSITPLWDERGRAMRARLVPEAICRRCLGEKGMLKPEVGRPPHPQWPSSYESFQ